MIVYDIVQIVDPGTITSVPPGRWLTDHRNTEAKARFWARLCTDHASAPGVRYEVEAHENECPGRASVFGGLRESGPCQCGGSNAGL